MTDRPATDTPAVDVLQLNDADDRGVLREQHQWRCPKCEATRLTDDRDDPPSCGHHSRQHNDLGPGGKSYVIITSYQHHVDEMDYVGPFRDKIAGFFDDDFSEVEIDEESEDAMRERNIAARNAAGLEEIEADEANA